jgi:hypothetical protein
MPDRDPAAAVDVPEPRTVKTRLHLDIRLPAADPEGNEFCAFAPGR